VSNPVLPIVAGTAHHVIHGGLTPPTPSDVGIASAVGGVVITDLKTSFPVTTDSYLDPWLQPLTDIEHSFGFEFSFNVETHLRSQGATASDMGIPTVTIGSLVDADLVSILLKNDCRGWHPDPGGPAGTTWAPGTKFIITDGSGTYERQKLKKEAINLAFRRYQSS
jgi:hypothetical protein